MQRNRHFKTLLGGLLILSALFSCKKKESSIDTPPPTNGNSGAVTTNDSIFFVTKDIYLWTNVLPDSATFKPNSFSSTRKMFDSLITYESLDRYSFLDDGTTSRALQEGIVGDKGFEVGYQTDTTLFVVYVYPGSPADKAGIKRGWQLLSANGFTKFNYYDNGATDDALNEAFSTGSGNFQFKKPDGTTQQNTIASTTYQLNPILYSKLFDLSGVKVGYLVFNNFVALADVQTKLDSIFNAFAAAGAKKLIIDLRYNGGGLVETSEYIANRLVPAAKSNTVMYTQSFNDNVNNKKFSRIFQNMKALPYYPTYNWTDIFYSEATTYKTAKFSKIGSWELDQVNFLVSHSTVSASELLCNNLKPAMNIKLVGTTTYGKPVGFINITFGSYDVYAVCFQTKNSLGQGDYFTGLKPDITVGDDFSNDWGSFNDPLLKQSLIDMGVQASVLGRSARIASGRILATTTANRLQATKFKGMIQSFKR
ncbi:hypothetical protein DVR12_10190 [Chitinophaga silvatica]|uniref:PDZ domain-containing protein n=1 Tax=Chitinophaga silvatica TaxID=2282649 RepID=A0A3E1YBB7_9BACT|nr:S41 family peptidase [Chitinophaga silvatica]RFS23377.1 hypothetical protein DVR12_10190 [Chitinophaga silvatica]